jgi:hypothetical protein
VRHSYSVLICVVVASPAFSQVQTRAPGFDITGTYVSTPNEEITGDPSLVDYLAIPLNEGGRAWALAWNPARLDAPAHQCEAHTVA